MQKSYCYTPGVRVRVGVSVSVGVGVRMQNVRANVKVMEFQSLCIFSCILTLLIILIKPLATKAHDRRVSGDCGTSGDLWLLWWVKTSMEMFYIHNHIGITFGSINTSLRFGSLLVLGLYKEDYSQICKCTPITQLLQLVGMLGSRKLVKPLQLGCYCYSNWLSYVGPQSMCNRSLWWRFCVVTCFLDFSVGVRDFVICLSQISSLFS